MRATTPATAANGRQTRSGRYNVSARAIATSRPTTTQSRQTRRGGLGAADSAQKERITSRTDPENTDPPGETHRPKVRSRLVLQPGEILFFLLMCEHALTADDDFAIAAPGGSHNGCGHNRTGRKTIKPLQRTGGISALIAAATFVADH